MMNLGAGLLLQRVTVSSVTLATGVFLSAGMLGSCVHPVKKLKGDRAFITYTPPPQGSDHLKVAVKDLIDVK
ncbi:MAG: hypothetical protein ACAI34_03130, partial [Verrucomicrobium sp.]|nr:hypothetical protein [Verrucomicrobium sp.]